MRIETSRHILRRAQPGDLDALHAILSDPVVMQYWATPPHTSLAQTRAWLDDMIASERNPLRDDFVVELDGAAIGKVGCWRLPEIGYALGRDHWNKGFGREAVTAVIDYIFATHAIPAITADVDPRNTGSLALLASLGFQETGRMTGTMLIGGVWCDSVYLALQRR